MLGGARRRAEKERETPATAETDLSAYDILHDVQTLGARIAASEPNLITVMVGYSAISITGEEGADILNEAGQPEAAARLRARARELLRPRLLAYLMSSKDIDSLRPGAEELTALENDPALIEEAKRLAALRRGYEGQGGFPRFGQDGDLERSGFITSFILPNFNMTTPWTTPPVALDELRTTAHFEIWGGQKFLAVFLIVAVWAAFLVLLLLYAAGSRALRNAAPDRWPSPQQALAAGVFFGVLAAAPGFAAAAAGNFLWQPTGLYLIWHVFWNLWGLLVAFWALGFWSRRFSCPDRPGAGPWMALTGLLIAAPYAWLVYSGVLAGERSGMLWGNGIELWVYAFFLLFFLPTLVWGACALVRWLRVLLGRPATGASSVPGLRLFLAGLAGGIVLWSASCWLVGQQERKWGERDTLITPNAAAIGFTPAEARFVDLHGENIERVLGKAF